VIQHQGQSVNPRRQEAPHAHSINVDPTKQFAVAADLGLDKLLVYKLDAKAGTLTPNDPPFARVDPGAGPRHFAFHPNGRFAYVINEMALTVTAFTWDGERGALETVDTVSTLPADFQGSREGLSTAEVQVHPSGKFVYGSNRGHDTIAIFAVDLESGRLTPVGHQPTGGKVPRNFGIDPTGQYLLAANQDSDTVVVFRIDEETGKLSPTGQTVEVPTPVCVKFVDLE
jgi:6-phosphogluconolactonase